MNEMVLYSLSALFCREVQNANKPVETLPSCQSQDKQCCFLQHFSIHCGSPDTSVKAKLST